MDAQLEGTFVKTRYSGVSAHDIKTAAEAEATALQGSVAHITAETELINARLAAKEAGVDLDTEIGGVKNSSVIVKHITETFDKGLATVIVVCTTVLFAILSVVWVIRMNTADSNVTDRQAEAERIAACADSEDVIECLKVFAVEGVRP